MDNKPKKHKNTFQRMLLPVSIGNRTKHQIGRKKIVGNKNFTRIHYRFSLDHSQRVSIRYELLSTYVELFDCFRSFKIHKFTRKMYVEQAIIFPKTETVSNYCKIIIN